jgi:hypothetical protein
MPALTSYAYSSIRRTNLTIYSGDLQVFQTATNGLILPEFCKKKENILKHYLHLFFLLRLSNHKSKQAGGMLAVRKRCQLKMGKIAHVYKLNHRYTSRRTETRPAAWMNS